MGIGAWDGKKLVNMKIDLKTKLPTIVKYSKVAKAALYWKKALIEIGTIKEQEKCNATKLQEGKFNINHCFYEK